MKKKHIINSLVNSINLIITTVCLAILIQIPGYLLDLTGIYQTACNVIMLIIAMTCIYYYYDYMHTNKGE